MAHVTYKFWGQKKTVQGKEGQTILQIALDNDIPMEHACGGNGFCTTCICCVEKGMENVSPRSEQEENMGITEDPDRLSCQSKVLGDIEVEIPD
jgi:ferredoxin, 2Fe-2S